MNPIPAHLIGRDPQGMFSLEEAKTVLTSLPDAWMAIAYQRFMSEGRGAMFAAFTNGRLDGIGYMPRAGYEGSGMVRLLEMLDTYQPARQYVLVILWRLIGDDGTYTQGYPSIVDATPA